MQEKKRTRSKIVTDALRKYYGESVGEFAERLGVKASTVSSWAARDNVDEDLIYRMIPNVNYDFLLTGEGEMFKAPSTLVPPAVVPQSASTSVARAYLAHLLEQKSEEEIKKFIALALQDED